MTERMTYRWLWSCLIAGGLLLLAGCTDKYDEVQLPSPMPQPEEGSQLELHAITRTSGAYTIPDANNPATSIKLFLATLTPTNDNPNLYTLTDGTFSYNNNQWSSSSAILRTRAPSFSSSPIWSRALWAGATGSPRRSSWWSPTSSFSTRGDRLLCAAFARC